MNTDTKHPCEAVEASADVMKLAQMILSDCGCSTAISDRLQRRVAGRIQQHMDSALGDQQQAEPVAFRAGNLVTYNQDEYPGLGTWHVQLWDGESIAARVYGNDREELNRRIAALLAAAPQAAVPVPDELIDELEQCSMVMHYLGATDAEDIDSDTFELLGEDEQGRDAYADVSIVEWAGRTATLLDKIAAAQKGGAA